ncbi:MAG: ATP-binding protein [Desulfatiglans sp.]|jgi:signal transduction histidine kinase/CheY-like chemotaxis protein|nr:ATP-binding protein [Thermodesulfobacteriota bacterium]MEE4353178.1 ATP-binding protein [Desulfatiglans sp.]
MEQTRAIFDELERRRIQEYIFNLEDIQDTTQDLISEQKELEKKVEDKNLELRKLKEKLKEELSERKRAETEKKNLEYQFLQSQKLEAMGKLGGGIAHDFNNILTAIQGNISLMMMVTDPADPNWRQLNNIENIIERGSRLTSQILGYVRKGKGEIRPLSLNRLVEETLDAFSRTRKQIVVRKTLCPGSACINADLSQMEQVLVNLYINAADAMPDGGDLFLETGYISHDDMTKRGLHPKQRRYVSLTIADNGVGMDPNTQKRIFEPFFTTKKRGKGTGFGLSSVLGIVEDHGGYLSFYSVEGQGTTFEVYLPESEEVIKEQPIEIETFVGGTETILVVDDEETNIDVILRLLQALGYQVVTAMNGEKALAVFESLMGSVDLVILDLIMPGMGGAQVCERLRKIDPNVKVLFMSGCETAFEDFGLNEEDPKHYIQKPFRVGGLSRKVRELIDTEKGQAAK